jgi:VanZ family protein
VTPFLRRWAPALLWTAVLFAASSFPTVPVDLEAGRDKLAHFAAYLVLGLLLARGQTLARISPLWALVIGSLVGALDELYQSIVPGRHMDLTDWVADSLGVVAGVILYHAWRGSSARRSQPIPTDE